IFGPNERPFVVHEVTDRGTFEIVTIDQYVTLGSWLANMGVGYGYGNFEDHDVVNFINNHDSQRDDDSWRESLFREHEVDIAEDTVSPYTYSAFEYNTTYRRRVLNRDNRPPGRVTYKEGDLYRLALAFMLAWPYGYPMVTSSFYFQNRNQGPPHLGAHTGFA
ncbi:hypothetical protein TELCIR_21120, partial [Teladorsagia circumcincta]